MVVIRKKIIKGQAYYYLEHSIRNSKQVKKKEVYLGTKIPSNIEKIKKDFLNNIYKQRWYVDADRIKQRFSKEQRLMLKSVREKELREFCNPIHL